MKLILSLKDLKKMFVITLTFALLASYALPKSNVSAAEKESSTDEPQISVVRETTNSIEYDINVQDENIKMNIEKIDDSTVKVNSVTSTGEKHTMIYNEDNEYVTFDGVKEPLKISKYIDPEEENKSNQIQKLQSLSPIASSSGDWTPVYVATYQLDFSSSAASLSTLVTYIGGILAVAYLTGFSIAKSELSGKIGAWLGVIGMATTFASSKFKGYWTYAMWKTRGKVPTGYGSTQTAYRYQNSSLLFSMFGKTFYAAFPEKGSWWFSTKPY